MVELEANHINGDNEYATKQCTTHLVALRLSGSHSVNRRMQKRSLRVVVRGKDRGADTAGIYACAARESISMQSQRDSSCEPHLQKVRPSVGASDSKHTSRRVVCAERV